MMISLQIDREAIAEVNKSNFFSVIIDNKLSWKDYISFVCRKVARGIGVIIKAKKELRSECLKYFYYSFIYPYMIYCNQIWGSACKTNIEPPHFTLKGCKNFSHVSFRAIVYNIKICELRDNLQISRLMCGLYNGELRVFHGLFKKNIPVGIAITICHCVELTWGSVVWDMWAFLFGTAFLGACVVDV